MSRCPPKEKSFHDLKVKNLKVKQFCASEGKIKKLDSNIIKAKEITTEKLFLDGTDLSCLLETPSSVNVFNTYDCMDCDRNPIKPDKIDQDIWDVLTCNRNSWKESLQQEFLAGREEIRCIKLAYGCQEECPPDCPIPPDCSLTTCPSFPDNCNPVPPECIPDWKTCHLEIENKLYNTLTLPFFNTDETSCELVRFINNMSYNLDINNVTCNLASRVATVLVHFAFKTVGPTGPTGATGSSCPVCPGTTGPEPLSCFFDGSEGCSDLSTDVVCGIVTVNCRQYYYTVNINLGENFSNVVMVPSDIIKAMFDASPQPLDPNNVIGAFQLAIFLEDGLVVSNNAGGRDKDSKVGGEISSYVSVKRRVAR